MSHCAHGMILCNLVLTCWILLACCQDKLTEVRPLGKSSRAQLAMTVLSLHHLGLTDIAWHLFDQISKDGPLLEDGFL